MEPTSTTETLEPVDDDEPVDPDDRVDVPTDGLWSAFDASTRTPEQVLADMTTVIEPSPGVRRNVSLESLWFRLADPRFTTTGIVPIPGVTGLQCREFARELATVGAFITTSAVELVDAIHLPPTDAQLAVDLIEADQGSPRLVCVDSPTFDTAAIPVLRRCARTVLLVGLGTTTSEHLTEIVSIVGADHVVGAVCVERTAPRRLSKRRSRGT